MGLQLETMPLLELLHYFFNRHAWIEVESGRFFNDNLDISHHKDRLTIDMTSAHGALWEFLSSEMVNFAM
jgi:hypothetical protein